MPDLTALLNDRAAREWREIKAAVAAGRAPQTLVAILPPETAAGFRDLFARVLLCAEGSGTDGCASCEAWREDGHPDLVVAGSGEKAPGVDECIAFQASLPLRPVIAPRRLGVVPFADELSIPASNALLKIAEEPPAGVHILFTASADNLLPTIRSRAWTLSLDPVVSSAPPSPPPDGPAAWAAWFEATKKAPLADVIADARAWSAWFASRSEWRAAADLENFIYLSDKRHMAVSMVQDALHAILREGVRVEQLFGDLRET
jgi:DNA polymerase-3 subunit delta'